MSSVRLAPFVLAAAAAIPVARVQAQVPAQVSAAAPAPAPQALPSSLPDSLAIALNERAELRAATLQNDAARERTRQAAARFYPSVDLLMTTQRNKSYDTFTGITATGTVQGQTVVVDVARSSPRYTVNPSLQIGYDLYTGGRDSASVRNSQDAQRSSALRAEVLSREILREVTVDYLRLGQAWRRWQTATRWLEFAREHEQATAQRLAAGRASELESRTDALARAQRELDLRARAQDVSTRYAEFIGALGRHPEATAVRPESLAPLLAGFDHELETLDVRGLAPDAAAIAHTADAPESARAQIDAQAAREMIDVERAAYLPQVSLFAQYTGAGRSDSSVGSALGTERKGAYAFGVTVSVNLFSGFATQSRVSEAQINAARLNAEANELDTRLALGRSALESVLAQAQAQAQYTRQRREVGALQLQVAQAKADAGRGFADDVAQARMALEAIDADIADNRVDVVIARIKLQFVSSKDAAS